MIKIINTLYNISGNRIAFVLFRDDRYKDK